ncbi:MAG TPA: recombinase family protein, partial [Acetobacteraceae bacterium]|nr:recombinase family protein [Acetobacteraceae bacterium]
MTSKPKRAALYPRVSTDGQTVDSQRLALEAVCEQRGWQVTGVYCDNGVSGAKDRTQRPGLDTLLKDASRGRLDVVLAWALDRLGRSLVGLLDTLGELEVAGAALVLHQQTIDTTTPAGRMFFQVTGAFAEFERSIIRSRVKAGLDRAKARGVRLGRPRTGATSVFEVSRQRECCPSAIALRSHPAPGRRSASGPCGAGKAGDRRPGHGAV